MCVHVGCIPSEVNLSSNKIESTQTIYFITVQRLLIIKDASHAHGADRRANHNARDHAQRRFVRLA